MTHAIIYDRASTEQQRDNFSRVNAREYGIKIAEQNGFTWEYVKEIGSGTTLTGRPEMMKILDRIAAGEVQALIVQELDRLARPEEAVIYSTIRNFIMSYNVIIYTHTSRIDLNNDDDDFVADITMSVAKKERRRILKRMKRGIKSRAESGKFIGNPGLGYKITGQGSRSDLVINPDEKKVVEIIFNTLDNNGGNLRLTANHLNRLGCKTTYGNEFSSTTIKKIATRKLYIGIWQSTVTDIVSHRPDLQIISLDQFNRVQNLINSRAGNNKSMGRRGQYIFTGFVVCGGCGGPMVAANRKDKGWVEYHCLNRRKYGADICSKGKSYSEHLILPPVVDYLAGFMFNQVVTFHNSINAAAAQYGKSVIEEAHEATVTGELASVQAGKQRLVEGLSLGAITTEEVAVQMAKLRQREQELRLEIATIAESTAIMEDWQAALEAAKEKDRAGIAAHLFRMVKRRPTAFRRLLSIVFEPNSLKVRTERVDGRTRKGVLEDYRLTKIMAANQEVDTLSIDHKVTGLV